MKKNAKISLKAFFIILLIIISVYGSIKILNISSEYLTNKGTENYKNYVLNTAKNTLFENKVDVFIEDYCSKITSEEFLNNKEIHDKKINEGIKKIHEEFYGRKE